MLTITSPMALFVTSGVSVWAWPIYVEAICIDVPLWQVYKKGIPFYLHCDSEYVARGRSFDTNWSTEWVMLQWVLVEIRWFCAEVMISSCSTLSFRILQEWGVTVYVEEYSTCVVSCDVIWMCGGIINQLCHWFGGGLCAVGLFCCDDVQFHYHFWVNHVHII